MVNGKEIAHKHAPDEEEILEIYTKQKGVIAKHVYKNPPTPVHTHTHSQTLANTLTDTCEHTLTHTHTHIYIYIFLF